MYITSTSYSSLGQSNENPSHVCRTLLDSHVARLQHVNGKKALCRCRRHLPPRKRWRCLLLQGEGIHSYIHRYHQSPPVARTVVSATTRKMCIHLCHDRFLEDQQCGQLKSLQDAFTALSEFARCRYKSEVTQKPWLLMTSLTTARFCAW